jgi:hypothetical protein
MERHGDWSEQLNDYCPNSGLPMDHLIDELVRFGFTTEELRHLERLSDPAVLQQLPPEKRNLRHNVKTDVVLYMNTWATLLEDILLQSIDIRELVTGCRLPVSSNR